MDKPACSTTKMLQGLTAPSNRSASTLNATALPGSLDAEQLRTQKVNETSSTHTRDVQEDAKRHNLIPPMKQFMNQDLIDNTITGR